MKKIILSISGMTCSACSSGLEKYLNKQNGIEIATVNLIMATANIEYDENVVNLEKIENFIKDAGFKSLGLYDEKKIIQKEKNKKTYFLIYTVLAVLLMYISMGSMMNLPSIPLIDMHKNTANYLITMFVLTVLFLVYGFDILKNGFKNLIHKIPNMDSMVFIGVISSFLYSIYGSIMVLLGNTDYLHMLYFESSAIVIYFIKLGRYIDSLSKDKTKDAIKELVKITPENARVKVDGEEKIVTIDEVKKGDILIAKPGDKIAVDGKIVFGKSHIEESFITGESKAQEKGIGDTVIAGSINYNGYIEYEAEKIGRDSTISEIVRLVINAANSKLPIAKIADKISSIFVPTVIGIAIITFIVYLLLGLGFNSAIIHFVTVLVIACPCSLGLATPLAVVVAEGLAAKNGILIKKGEVLEKISKIDTVCFDKTGIITYGNLRVDKIKNYSEFNDDELFKILAAIESKSDHPIAHGIVEYAKEKGIDYKEVDNFESLDGLGIIGNIDGKKYYAGNIKILEKYNIDIKDEFKEDEKKLSENGCSIIYLADDEKVLALIGVNDIIRENVTDVIEYLKNNKIEVILLTGDNETVANKIAKEVGIDNVYSRVLPKEKLEKVNELKKQNKLVLMCGDGINDSPALARSDIGVSIKSGTDIAINSADVILTKNNLSGIINLIKIGNNTVRNIKQNLFWAFFYNALMIPVACGIFEFIGLKVNPMLASIAMVLSSITVILNALRLKKIKLIK